MHKNVLNVSCVLDMSFQFLLKHDTAAWRRPQKGLMRLFSIIPKEQQVLPFSSHMGTKLSSKNRAGKEG